MIRGEVGASNSEMMERLDVKTAILRIATECLQTRSQWTELISKIKQAEIKHNVAPVGFPEALRELCKTYVFVGCFNVIYFACKALQTWVVWVPVP